MMIASLLTILLVASAPGEAMARQRAVAVTGSVADVLATPLAGVVVRLDGAELGRVTDARGRFRLGSIVPGDYTLELSRPGFQSQTVRFTVSGEQQVDIDIGTIVMRRGAGPLVTVSGVVFDERTGAPVPFVPIRVNDRIVAVTDSGGAFHALTDVVERGGTNRLVLQRIGYTEKELEFVAPQSRDTLDFTILLRPAPVRLSEIGVEADLVPLTTGRMTGFYRRRATNFGHFFTRDDVKKMGARKATDVLRRIPGVTILSNENTTGLERAVGWIDPLIIRFHRTGSWRAGHLDCQPLVFVNDLQVSHPNLDALISADQIAGMEVYTSEAQVPIEYNKFGSECGVIVFWTDAPAGEAATDAHVEFGFQFGSQLRGGRSAAERIGVYLAVRLKGTLEFHPGFNFVVGGDDVTPAVRYQLFGNLKIRPFGRQSPWYVGSGGTLLKQKAPNTAEELANARRPGFEAAHVVLSGVSWSLGPIRSFAEIQLLDPLASGVGRTFVIMGFSVRSGG